MRDTSPSMMWRFSLWFGALAVLLASAARYVHYRATIDLLAREQDEMLWTRLGALNAERLLKPRPLVDDDLQLVDRSIATLREATDRHPSAFTSWVIPSYSRHRRESAFAWFAGVWKPDGTPVASAALPDDVRWQPHWQGHVGHLWTSTSGRYRYAATAAHDGCIMLAGTPLLPLTEACRDAAIFHAASLAAVIPIGLAGGWLLLSWLLAPLTRITRTAERIGNGQFTDRIELAGVDREIAGMATTINSMLDRLDDVRVQLEEFNGNLAHQVLGPVHGILLEADTTLREPRSAEELTERLASVRGLAARLESLCEALLVYSRTVITDVVRLPVVDLEPIVDEAVEHVAAHARAAGVAIHNRAGSMRVRGNADLLVQVFVNLLSNAIAASPYGSAVTIESAASPQGSIVRVVDHGVGVPAASRDGLFTRRDSRRPDAGGHGFGLSICQSIMHRHGGDIGFEDTPGGGATFAVTFPAVLPDASRAVGTPLPTLADPRS